MNALRTVSLALLVLAAAAMPAFGPTAADADAPGKAPAEAQLLIKCKRSEIGGVLAALAKQRVRVYDLATMNELRGPGKTPTPPSLPDAAEAMRAFSDALKALPKAVGAVRINEMSVNSKRLMATVEIEAASTADQIPPVVSASPHFRGRAARVDLGAMARTAAGRWTAKVQILFRSSGPSDAEAKALGAVPLDLIERSARTAGMDPLHASAERRTWDRRCGYGIASRELAYAPSTLPKLEELLASLQAAPGLTVTELRWKRDDKSADTKDIQKSIVRVATRANTP